MLMLTKRRSRQIGLVAQSAVVSAGAAFRMYLATVPEYQGKQD